MWTFISLFICGLAVAISVTMLVKITREQRAMHRLRQDILLRQHEDRMRRLQAQIDRYKAERQADPLGMLADSMHPRRQYIIQEEEDPWS